MYLALALTLVWWTFAPPRSSSRTASTTERVSLATEETPTGAALDAVDALERVLPPTQSAGRVSLTAHVVGCDGATRAGVDVEAWRGSALLRSSTSADDGVVAWTDLPAGDEPLTLRVREPEIEMVVDSHATEVDIVLAPPGTFLRGRVRSTDGSRGPWQVACIPIDAWDPHPVSPRTRLERADVRHARTDAVGRFQVCELAPGAYVVAVGATGRRPLAPPRLVDTRDARELSFEVVPVFAVGVERTGPVGAPLEVSPLAGPMHRGVSFGELDDLEHVRLDPIQSCLAGRCDVSSSSVTWITFVARGAPPTEPIRARFEVREWGYREASVELPIARLDLAELARVELESLAERRGRLVIDWFGAPACAAPAAQLHENALALVLKPDSAIDRREWRFHLDLADPRSTVIDALPFGSYRARVDGPGRRGGELPLHGGAHELSIGADDAHWSIDLSNTGCVRFVPRREDGSAYTGSLQVFAVRKRTGERTRGTFHSFAGREYVWSAIPAGRLEMRITSPSELRSADFTVNVRAGDVTVVELGPGGPIGIPPDAPR